MGQIAIIDDDDQIRFMLKQVIELDSHTVHEADTAKRGLKMLAEYQPDVLFLDINLPDAYGLDLLGNIHHDYPFMPIIMVTAEATIDKTIEALKTGAFDFLPKPFDMAKLQVMIKNAIAHHALEKENFQLRNQLGTHISDRLIGESEPMRQVKTLIDRAKDTQVTVCISGESGTGKEQIAREIHFTSLRKDKPFVAVNCAAIPETLIESELFGHERGSFTGAEEQVAGKFEQANGGTIFLDEIGDMPLTVQAKLLRVLQEKEIIRVGGREPIPISLRVISATNRDLKRLVAANNFREDLYYRLSVFPLQVAPLRDRKEDIPLLTASCLKKFQTQLGTGEKNVSRRAMEALLAYQWPGNIRELENALQRSMVLAQTATIELEDLPAELQTLPTRSPGAESGNLELSEGILPFEDYEKQVILKVLQKLNGNISKAAQALKLDRTTLHRKIKRYNLEKELLD